MTKQTYEVSRHSEVLAHVAQLKWLRDRIAEAKEHEFASTPVSAICAGAWANLVEALLAAHRSVMQGFWLHLLCVAPLHLRESLKECSSAKLEWTEGEPVVVISVDASCDELCRTRTKFSLDY